MDDPDFIQYPNLSRVGHSVNSFLLYKAQRLFIDQNEVRNSPDQLLGGEVMAGDIKYINQPDAYGNYDNVINSNDRIYMRLSGGAGNRLRIRSISSVETCRPLNIFFKV